MKKASVFVSAVICALLAFGCSDDGEKAKGPGAPPEKTSARTEADAPPDMGLPEDVPESIDQVLAFKPEEPRANDTLRLLPGPYKIPQGSVEWYLNGIRVPLAAGSMTFDISAAEAASGDTIFVVAAVGGGRVRSRDVTVRNTPPKLTAVTILPEQFKPGDRISVEPEAVDPDGDEIEYFYKWTVNDEPAGEEAELDRVLERGDRFTLSVTPFDGTDYGKERSIERDFVSSPPVLEQHYEYSFDGTTYTYEARATDPDGDPLRFGLRDAPEGMKIDPFTGVVTWVVPEDFLGSVDYAVTVADPSGGRSVMEMTFTLK